MEFKQTRIQIDSETVVLLKLSDSCSHDPEELAKICAGVSVDDVPEGTNEISIGEDYKWGHVIFSKDDLFFKVQYLRKHLDRQLPFNTTWSLQRNFVLADECGVSTPKLHGFFTVWKHGYGWLYCGSIEENLSDCTTLEATSQDDMILMKRFIKEVSDKKFMNYDMHFGNVMKDSTGKCIMVDLDNCSDAHDSEIANAEMQQKCLNSIPDEELRWKCQQIFESQFVQ